MPSNRMELERLGGALGMAFPVDNYSGMGLSPLPAAWKCDLATDRLTWAPGVFEIFGVDPDASIRRDEIVAMYCDQSREELDWLRRDAIAQLHSFTFEARLRRRDGALRWMRVTADVAQTDGRATHLYGMKQDITVEMMLSGALC